MTGAATGSKGTDFVPTGTMTHHVSMLTMNGGSYRKGHPHV